MGLRLAKGTAKPTTCCWLARWFDCSRWVATSSLPPFAIPVSVSWVRLGKSNKLILDVRDTVAGPHTEHGCSCTYVYMLLHLQGPWSCIGRDALDWYSVSISAAGHVSPSHACHWAGRYLLCFFYLVLDSHQLLWDITVCTLSWQLIQVEETSSRDLTSVFDIICALNDRIAIWMFCRCCKRWVWRHWCYQQFLNC
jgi:hypothetical protein